MKGIVISEVIVVDEIHGFKNRIKRLIIPEWENLCITVYDNEIIVFRYDDWQNQDCTVVAEIDVPFKIIREARIYLAARDRIRPLMPDFESIIKQTG